MAEACARPTGARRPSSDMAFRLRDNLHWCVCDGQVILLDVEADRYFGLPASSVTAFERAADGRVRPEDCERLRPLIAQGLLIEDPASRGLSAAAALPATARDFPHELDASPGIATVIRAFVSEIRFARLLRSKPLLDVLRIVEQARTGRRGTSGHADRRLGSIIGASITVSLVLRAADRCLVRALAVQWACRRHGISSKLVFGVRAEPFAAHCWVQLNETVLVGDFEQVRLFTPILVLG